ncbi:alpha/beta hydrolase family protein [Nocardia araoensis]|uniref:alpha/beta hydrolase family protein n=1 Tax=Nocardia araoensis TaxID=228600 RepID=UPI0002E9D809|nr:alpha/beta fold hydrolase [Nocardia araoensis]
MKFLFDDESFAFEALRTACFAEFGGADLGEVLAVARAVPDGDEEAWCRQWTAAGDRARALGGRQALLRASNYYRTAEFFRRDDPFGDPVAKDLFARAQDTFAEAAQLMDTPVQAVEIPYEDTHLPGLLFLADDSGTPRPTIILTSGFDSPAEEAYFALAAAALPRGYNVLAYDGPGQGAALRHQRLFFRPDWEAVLTPVVDYALTRTEVDAEHVYLYGYSLGGFLTPRAAAFEHRVAGLILDGGIYSYYDVNFAGIPPVAAEWVMAGRDDVADPVAHLMMANHTGTRWALRNGPWSFGTDTISEYLRRTKEYTLDGLADRITAPTLIFAPDNDHFFAGQPERLHRELTCPATLIPLHSADGAGEHCAYGARSTLLHHMFAWLDTL